MTLTTGTRLGPYEILSALGAKPGNVLLTKSGVKLPDFGLAKRGRSRP